MADIVEILTNNREQYEAPIDYIVIDGTKFTNYGAFTFMWEKSYIDDESLKRANDGSIPQIEDAAFFITPHLKIDFSLLSIDDYRELLRLEYENNQHFVIVYDTLLKQEWICEYMYIATLEMPKLWTIVENRQKGTEHWEHWISVCGVKDYTVELIGTNNPCNIPPLYLLYAMSKGNNGNSQWWGCFYSDETTTFTFRDFKQLYEKFEEKVADGYSIYDIGSQNDENLDTSVSYYRKREYKVEKDNYDEVQVNPTVLTANESGEAQTYNIAVVDKFHGLIDEKTNVSFVKLDLFVRIAEQTIIPFVFATPNGSTTSPITYFPTNTWLCVGSSEYAHEIREQVENFSGYFNTQKDGSGANMWGYEAEEDADYIMFVLKPTSNNVYSVEVYSGLDEHKLVLRDTLTYQKGDTITLYAQTE